MLKDGGDFRQAARRASRCPAWHWLFPLAALHAALMVPLSLLALRGGTALLPGLATPAGHGRELLFGFALAVVAGYLLGPLPRRRLALLTGLWLLGRLGLLAEGGLALMASLADAAFALLLALWLVPRFRAAKKWRNRLLAPLLGLLCLLSVVTLVAAASGGASLPILLHQGVLWLTLLMTFMGGRVIAPAVNGHLTAGRRRPSAGVQPRLEAALIALLMAAALAWEPAGWLAGGLLLVAAAAVALRLWRWAPWRLGDRPDLLALMLGYGWLGAGMIGLALVRLSLLPMATALHAITVGALGTLASGIMLRQAILRAKGRPAGEPILAGLALLFSLAAGLRLGLPGTDGIALWAAALAWSLGWLLVTWRLLQWRRRDLGRDAAMATSN